MKNSISNFSLLLIFFLLSCNQQNELTDDKYQQFIDEIKTGKEVYIIDKNNQKEWAVICIKGNKVNFAVNGMGYKGKFESKQKVYRTIRQEKYAAVKLKDDQQFRLIFPEKSYFWEVEIHEHGEELKFFDNEEELNPYEVEQKEKNEFDIEMDYNDIGTLSYNEQKEKAYVKSGKNIFKIKSSRNSKAFGILAVDEIAAPAKMILIAETLIINQ